MAYLLGLRAQIFSLSSLSLSAFFFVAFVKTLVTFVVKTHHPTNTLLHQFIKNNFNSFALRK
jgi:hypothetical protein